MKNIKQVCLLVVALLFWFSHGQAQGLKERTITQLPFANSPIELMGIYSNGVGEIASGKSFVSDTSWLKGLSLKVKNVSDKNIIGLEYKLLLSKFPASGPPIMISIGYGKYIQDPEFQGTGFLPPGAEVVISPDKEEVDFLAADFEKRKGIFIHDTIKIGLIIQAVYFDNETFWAAESLFSTKDGKAISSANDTFSSSKINTQPAITPNLFFCGTINSQGQVTCCRKNGCFTQVTKITLRELLPGEGKGFAKCTSDGFPCRCDPNKICTNDVAIACGGIVTGDCF